MEIKTSDISQTVLSRSVEDMREELRNLYKQKTKAVESIREISKIQHRSQYFLIQIKNQSIPSKNEKEHKSEISGKRENPEEDEKNKEKRDLKVFFARKSSQKV